MWNDIPHVGLSIRPTFRNEAIAKFLVKRMIF